MTPTQRKLRQINGQDKKSTNVINFGEVAAANKCSLKVVRHIATGNTKGVPQHLVQNIKRALKAV